MSKKTRVIYAKQGAKYKDFFIASKETKEISDELFKELQGTRFFKHGILIEKKVEKKEETNRDQNETKEK